MAFNTSKTKCLLLQPHSLKCTSHAPRFYVGGNSIEVVDTWQYLGHITTYTLSDVADVNKHN